SYIGMDRLDGQETVAALEDAEGGDDAVDVAGGGDEVEAFDEGTGVVLGAPEDGAAGGRGQGGAAGPAGGADLRAGEVADHAHVDPPLPVDLDAAEEGGVETAAGGKVEEIGQRNQGTGAPEQVWINGRNREVIGAGIDAAGDVEVDEVRGVEPLRQQDR